jgi:glutathione S-transferase
MSLSGAAVAVAPGPGQLHLYTITVSHFCEAARWALQAGGVDFTEQTALPGLHMVLLPARPAESYAAEPAARYSTPFACSADGRFLPDSWSIVELCTGRGLLRGAPGVSAGVRQRLDQDVGPAVRTVVYSRTLVPGSRFLADIAAQASTGQSWAWWLAGGVISKQIRARLVRDDAYVLAAEARLQAAREFLEAELRLGEDESAWDTRLTPTTLAVCALYAPMVSAPGYMLGTGMSVPALHTMPVPMQELVAAHRATRLGRYVLKMYELHRAKSGSKL